LIIEDKILVWRFNRGSKDAFRRIYEKYKDALLGLAVTMLRDRSLAEDIVHDVFVSFAGTVGTFHLSGTLKGYLLTCVGNRVRDCNRLKSERDIEPNFVDAISSNSDGPMEDAIGREESGQLQELLTRIPYEQREVIVLHLHHRMRFGQIAKSLGVSINTVQSRYRYGLDKLRSIMSSEVTK
jgi:RNA polymerase sigma factor (sigma-70 family)